MRILFPILISIFSLYAFTPSGRSYSITTTDLILVNMKQVRYSLNGEDTVLVNYSKKWSAKFATDHLPDIYYTVPKTNINIALPMSMFDPSKADKIDVKTVKSGDLQHQGAEYDQSFTRDFDSTGHVGIYSGTGCKGCTYTPFEYHYTWSKTGKLLNVMSVENVTIMIGESATVVQNEIQRMKLKYDSQDRLCEIVYAEDAVQGWRLYFTYQ